MGLDQYATAHKGEGKFATTTWKLADGGERVETHADMEWEDSMELAYWRKHPNLQGFMEEKWCGEGEFNCVDIELDLKDIDELEEAVKGSDLPDTGGFFFGGDSSEHYKEQDLQFCADARKALEDGYTVVYSSWW
jgi:hypothetical protein